MTGRSRKPLVLLEPLEQLEAAAVGQPQVEHQAVDASLLEHPQGLLAAADRRTWTSSPPSSSLSPCRSASSSSTIRRPRTGRSKKLARPSSASARVFAATGWAR